jgi:Flp pilus assembly protein CpaB
MDGPKTVTAVWTTSYTQLYVIAGVIAVIAVVAVVLLLRRRRAGPSAIKPPPPPPPPSEVPESVEEPPSTTPETETVPKREVSVAIRCTNCGHELKTGQIYCPECGQKQTD